MIIRSIYSQVPEDELLPIDQLEKLLRKHVIGLNLSNLPLRTRSKVVKAKVCEALNYPIPQTFKKTKPRFPCQNLDVITQKSKNIQIWNDEVDENRRYAILKVDNNDVVSNVRVISGTTLAGFDKTGTLTQKFQAILPIEESSTLYLKESPNVVNWLSRGNVACKGLPTDPPVKGQLLPIKYIYDKLSSIIGSKFPEISKIQERNRGSYLHKEVCRVLGFSEYRDNGDFPDIPNQLLEVKLQTSQTIDLGKHRPNDVEEAIKHFVSNDIRYAIFYGTVENGIVEIKKLFMVNGENFFELIKPIKGISKKIQLPIPKDFFS